MPLPKTPQVRKLQTGTAFARGRLEPDTTTRLPVIPRTDFVILCSPSELEVYQGEVLPRLVLFPISGGVAGVEEDNAGNITSWRPAVEKHCQDTGRVMVDPMGWGMKLQVNGEERTPSSSDPRNELVVRYATTQNIYTYALIWDTPQVQGNRVLWNRDEEGFMKFRKDLMELLEPDTRLIEEARQAAQNTLDRLEAEAEHRPTAKAMLAQARKTLLKPEKKPGKPGKE